PPKSLSFARPVPSLQPTTSPAGRITCVSGPIRELIGDIASCNVRVAIRAIQQLPQLTLRGPGYNERDLLASFSLGVDHAVTHPGHSPPVRRRPGARGLSGGPAGVIRRGASQNRPVALVELQGGRLARPAAAVQGGPRVPEPEVPPAPAHGPPPEGRS